MSLPPLLPAEAELTADDFVRYSRQIIRPELGVVGQRRLASAKVLVIGAGGLGSPILLYLAAAGVGTIGILDSDRVELSNLHRQIVHGTAEIGHSKVGSAAAAVAALNPAITVVEHEVRLDSDNANALICGYDLVLDGADNFPTRYLVNDTCANAGIPLVWGSVLGFAGQVSVFWAAAPGGAGTQLRDLFPNPPAPGSVPSCAEAGVLGAVCGQVGSIMASEAIKLLTGIGRPLLGRVLVVDVLDGTWDQVPLRPRSGGTATDSNAEALGRALDAPSEGRNALNPITLTPTRLKFDSSASGPTVLMPDPDAFGSRTERSRPSGPSPKALLLDVRTAAEFEVERIVGSVNLPLAELLAGAELTCPQGTPITVICRSGARAEVAVAVLSARGVEAEVLPGGLLSLAENP